MNYTKVYNEIIKNRQNNPLPADVYSEKHHIMPKSLGGTNSNSNLVRLTAREHYICHALLAEMYEVESDEWYKMQLAFHMMHRSSLNHERYYNSKLFEFCKKNRSKTMSHFQTGRNNSQFGTKWITNGTLNKKINKLDAIPLGFTKGRTSKRKVKIKCNTDILYNGCRIKTYQQNKLAEIFNISKNIDGIIYVHNLLMKLYVTENKSLNDIAIMFNTNNETIRNYCKMFKIKRRTLSDSIKLKTRR